MITAQEARENMDKSFEGFMEAISNDIRERSSENLDYLVVMVPSCLNAEDVRVALLKNGFMVSGDDSYKDTFEVSW